MGGSIDHIKNTHIKKCYYFKEYFKKEEERFSFQVNLFME